MTPNKNINELIGYSIQFVSYIVYNLQTSLYKEIKEAILFGSVTRGEATSSSDIDIFFNTFTENKILFERIQQLTKKFYTTEYYRIWKNLGINNEIKPIVGILDKWSLKQSIIANGITLFSKYTAQITKGKSSVLLYWPPIKSQSKRVLLSKKLYGYSYKHKKYQGVLASTGTKLSSNCIMIPIEDSARVIGIFKDLQIQFRMIYFSKME